MSLYCNKTTRDISVLDRKSDEEDRDKERGRERERTTQGRQDVNESIPSNRRLRDYKGFIFVADVFITI